MNLGKVVATRGVVDSAAENPEFATFVVNSLSRYIRGDWGDLDKEDKEANEAAMNGAMRESWQLITAHLIQTTRSGLSRNGIEAALQFFSRRNIDT